MLSCRKAPKSIKTGSQALWLETQHRQSNPGRDGQTVRRARRSLCKLRRHPLCSSPWNYLYSLYCNLKADPRADRNMYGHTLQMRKQKTRPSLENLSKVLHQKQQVRVPAGTQGCGHRDQHRGSRTQGVGSQSSTQAGETKTNAPSFPVQETTHRRRGTPRQCRDRGSRLLRPRALATPSPARRPSGSWQLLQGMSPWSGGWGLLQGGPLG